ncbi:MAG: TerB family tellurite resistance protein [Crocinitomicaceae bacterium]
MLAFIIFGTRGIRSTMKEGTFYCPQCISEQRYKHKKVTQFFTLYFIPLIPLGNRGNYVECQVCRNTFIERVLSVQPVIDITEEETPQQQPSIAQTAAPVAALTASNSLAAEAKIVSEKQKAVKKLLIMMILADGKVENAEIHMFHKVFKEITNDAVGDIYKEIEAVRSENKQPRQYLKEVASMLNDEGKKDILKASMMIAASDGDIDEAEVRMVENFGKALEMRMSEVKEIIQQIS